jgi:tetratricopeptide (TPR) repeat protein
MEIKYSLNSARIVFLFVILTALSMDAYASTRLESILICPVCESQTVFVQIFNSDSLGGQDKDLLVHATGDNPILYQPVTCKKCLYSGYEPDFNTVFSKDKTVIPDKIKTKILNEKALKLFRELKKDEPMPAWIKYDLIAQTYRILGKDKKAIAEQYLRASWALRLEDDFFRNLEEKIDAPTKEKYQKWRSKRTVRSNLHKNNPALMELDRALSFYGTASSAQAGEDKFFGVIAAISLARPHGDDVLALDAIALLKGMPEEKQYEGFMASLKDSISLESQFRKKAIESFEALVQTEPKPEEKARMLYLCGELYRQVENYSKALEFFNQLLQMEKCSVLYLEFAKEEQPKTLIEHRRELVNQLIGSDSSKWESAQRELLNMGRNAKFDLERALKNAPNPDAKARLEKIISQISSQTPSNNSQTTGEILIKVIDELNKTKGYHFISYVNYSMTVKTADGHSDTSPGSSTKAEGFRKGNDFSYFKMYDTDKGEGIADELYQKGDCVVKKSAGGNWEKVKSSDDIFTDVMLIQPVFIYKFLVLFGTASFIRNEKCEGIDCRVIKLTMKGKDLPGALKDISGFKGMDMQFKVWIGNNSNAIYQMAYYLEAGTGNEESKGTPSAFMSIYSNIKIIAYNREITAEMPEQVKKIFETWK